VLIEEPENHLSHSKLNALIEHISSARGDRQLIITTHSSFVLNKLGIENVLLFGGGVSATLSKLPPGTQNYFLKLPGHDTLRMILAQRTILVEGPSDELIVQAAFRRKHGKMPLEAGVDVISVRSLAFRRFLEIAAELDLWADVITDNDGDVDALKRKYDPFKSKPRIKIHYDSDINYRTLEPQLLKCNDRATINDILGRNFQTDAELLSHMSANKADVALRFFETDKAWVVPGYIEAALG
jgi:predicted ATP-dependent endonuclease of OLD family